MTIQSSVLALDTVVSFVRQWLNLPSGETGAPSACSQYTDRSVQVEGVMDGASLRVEGSNNGTDWAILSDLNGNDLVFTTSNRIKQVSEATAFIRPAVVGGGGLTDISVYVLLKE